MKSKLGWVVAGVLVFGGILCGFFHAALSWRTGALASRQPLTLQELDRLAAKAGMSAVIVSDAEVVSLGPKAARVPYPVATTGSQGDPERPLPRLRRPAPPEALAEKLRQEKGLRVPPIEIQAFKMVECAAQFFGAKDVAALRAFEVGQQLMRSGDLDGARCYYYAALDGLAEVNAMLYRQVCADLAWLEQDPEKASRLLEMSCDSAIPAYVPSEEWRRIFETQRTARLWNAVDLARATGSEELEELYREQIEAVPQEEPGSPRHPKLPSTVAQDDTETRTE